MLKGHEAREWLTSFDIVKYKENDQTPLHKYMRLIQKTRRIWEVI